ncbi:MAG TPA: hypothetical protein VNX01_00410 [Bacteroidia bacterium]|nr:hypothetical protein [Bacteroidia bacterium]
MKNSLFIIGVLITLFACKKSSTTTSASAPAQGTNLQGLYQIENQFTDKTLSGGLKDSNCFAIAVVDNNISAVTVNNIVLTLSQTMPYYATTNTLTPMQGKATWHVSSSNGVGAFTCTTVKNIPYFTDLRLSLSSFSKSSNLVISHSIIMGDTIIYTITDGQSNSATKKVANSSTGTTFTPAMMASMVAGPNAFIQIEGTATEYSVQGGKTVAFQNASTYIKNGITIN